MLIDRTFTIPLVALAIVIAVGILRPSGEHINSGLDPDEFWIRKAFTEDKYDLILAGDSRVYRGLSPKVMNETFTRLKIFNYGFSGNGYNRQYLDAISKIIDSNSSMPAIILGITPMSLTEGSSKRNDFLQLKEKGIFERTIGIYFSKLILLF